MSVNIVSTLLYQDLYMYFEKLFGHKLSGVELEDMNGNSLFLTIKTSHTGNDRYLVLTEENPILEKNKYITSLEYNEQNKLLFYKESFNKFIESLVYSYLTDRGDTDIIDLIIRKIDTHFIENDIWFNIEGFNMEVGFLTFLEYCKNNRINVNDIVNNINKILSTHEIIFSKDYDLITLSEIYSSNTFKDTSIKKGTSGETAQIKINQNIVVILPESLLEKDAITLPLEVAEKVFVQCPLTKDLFIIKNKYKWNNLIKGLRLDLDAMINHTDENVRELGEILSKSGNKKYILNLGGKRLYNVSTDEKSSYSINLKGNDIVFKYRIENEAKEIKMNINEFKKICPIVIRHVMIGDNVRIERNPKIHTGSVADMKVKAITTDTNLAMRIPTEVLSNFNADFDGDSVDCNIKIYDENNNEKTIHISELINYCS